jgi:hypothetical protein
MRHQGARETNQVNQVLIKVQKKQQEDEENCLVEGRVRWEGSSRNSSLLLSSFSACSLTVTFSRGGSCFF